jgi:hypothetical protein
VLISFSVQYTEFLAKLDSQLLSKGSSKTSLKNQTLSVIFIEKNAVKSFEHYSYEVLNILILIP